jgi:hypothetical protein
MKRTLVIAVIVVAVAAAVGLAARSNAAVTTASADPRIAVLQKQVRVLQGQVKVLQKHLVSDEGAIGVNFEGDTCLGAQLADLIQGTWTVVDQLSAATQEGKTYFGTQTQVNDYKTCADLANPDVPRPGIVVPPTVSPLQTLLQWLYG